MYRRKQGSQEVLDSNSQLPVYGFNRSSPNSNLQSPMPPQNPYPASSYAHYASPTPGYGVSQTYTPSPPQNYMSSPPNVNNLSSPYKNHAWKRGGLFTKLLCFAIIVGLAGGCYYFYSESNRQAKESFELQDRFITMEAKIQQVESRHKESIQQNDALRDKIAIDKRERASIEAREVAYLEEDERLRKYIQDQARRDTLNHFGEGPYRVLIELAFNDDVRSVQDWISLHPDIPEKEVPADIYGQHLVIIRLASLDEMPHAVNMFLHSVDAGLYNGVNFVAAPGHVVVTSVTASQREKFDSLAMGHLAFPEYSDKVPHEKWTVGFAGRPSGPNLYFNIIDNVRLHGPGGQGQYVLKNQADPCFARVIAGSDAIDRMNSAKKSNEASGLFNEPVTIRSARILMSDEYSDHW